MRPVARAVLPAVLAGLACSLGPSLESDLARLCSIAGEDDTPSEATLAIVFAKMETTNTTEAFDELALAGARAPGPERYAVFVDGAAAQGVDFSCPDLERLFAIDAAPEEAD